MIKIIKTLTITFLVTLLAASAVLFNLNGTVSAAGFQDESPAGNSDSDEGLTSDRLENQYNRIKRMIEKQADNIARLGDLVTKAQTRIDDLNGRDLDTSILVNALAAFESQLPVIQSAHNLTLDISSTHAGFSEDGMVVDVTAARQTLEEARANLKSTHELIRSATGNMRQALRDFKAANPRPTPAPDETPAA